MTTWDLPGVLRRIRRTADLSQREIARTCGVAHGVVAKAEAGTRDLPVRLLAELASVAGCRLALIGPSGSELGPMTADAVRDSAGRLFPAHLDTRHGDEDWWGGPHRPRLRMPRYTFDRSRTVRDWRRDGGSGAAVDHLTPQRGDSLMERATARRDVTWLRRDEERRRRWPVAVRLTGSAVDLTCSCPAGCEYAEGLNEDLAHAAECACRCDVG